jgi:hypothetical protein
MKNILYFFLAFTLLAGISSCSKEDAVMDKLKGNWQITEIKFNGDSTFNDFSGGNHYIEFWDTERAYTATGKGVYRIDYTNPDLKDFADTFRFDIKADQLAITYTQTATARNLIRYRYNIESYEGNELFLNRNFIDTVLAHLKANRL